MTRAHARVVIGMLLTALSTTLLIYLLRSNLDSKGFLEAFAWAITGMLRLLLLLTALLTQTAV